jgi:hypothetical protein
MTIQSLAFKALALVIGGASLAAQTSAAIVSQVMSEADKAKKIEAEIMSVVAQEKADTAKLNQLVDQADKTVKGIRGLLDKLDANYDQLDDSQKETVRTSWTVAMLLTAYVDNQKESMDDLHTTEGREEARVNALCAVRRADMLVDVVKGLRR